eukprot:CAMPEP_0197429222 /NCGR_PEP_ID=MMETSP1170-20131217/43305_1 /TAXON_ID=54406 /ORGANISM="Sarcinochrysis sp, Strain CCMP770" /LENGTH=58 /DNA_ID=CAMNT_0042957047 /DNA_START=26 /DNA_END=199 /DNA_ORIENTATION=+
MALNRKQAQKNQRKHRNVDFIPPDVQPDDFHVKAPFRDSAIPRKARKHSGAPAHPEAA